jgi:hypothetical protein
MAPDPGPGPVEPTEAAEREIATLLGAYVRALNTKDAERVQELYPSIPQEAIEELLGLPATDQYVMNLQPGTLRLGAQQETLEGEVASAVVGPDREGLTRLWTYTFGRGNRGWHIVSIRAGE